MSNSLEALEIIKCILSNHQTMLEEKDKRFEFINIIKKDLERKEELEKENLELKEEKEKWRKLCLCWREAYIECDEKFHNLLKEVLKDE